MHCCFALGYSRRKKNEIKTNTRKKIIAGWAVTGVNTETTVEALTAQLEDFWTSCDFTEKGRILFEEVRKEIKEHTIPEDWDYEAYALFDDYLQGTVTKEELEEALTVKHLVCVYALIGEQSGATFKKTVKDAVEQAYYGYETDYKNFSPDDVSDMFALDLSCDILYREIRAVLKSENYFE